MKKFFNRELSWIEFNARVLSESLRIDVPLLERLNFLSITEKNFDEFFQVRVASLKRQGNAESKSVLKRISERTRQLVKLEYSTLMNFVLPELKKEGVEYIKAENYTAQQKTFCEKYFKHDIFPLLTPLRTDTDFFPRIGNLNLNAAFLLEPKEGLDISKNALSARDKDIVALIQIPTAVERIVWLPSSGKEKQFALLDDIICMCGASLFPGYTAKETLVFKIARDADLAVDEEAGQQFIQAMEEVLVKRQSSFTVRMEYNSTSEKILEVLKSKLKLTDDDLYEIDGIIDPSSLGELQNIENSEEYKYPIWKNFNSNVLPEEGTYWNTLRQRDVLLNVPYESYDPVVKFIDQAAHDKNVLAIKMTLYRTGSNSPIVESLKEAAQNGKQVTVFVELKARFDEKRNISWAEELEQAGVIVIYGIVNLKVHAKICLVVRKESDGIRRYAHIGTGNYNPKTALVYQDLSVFTSNHEIVSDATLFFNVISGYSAVQTMHHLYMAPVSLKAKILELIQREIKQTTKDKPGHIIAKMNSLCHPEIIEALYEASKAGVKIDLNIRGICTLIPGIKKMSDNINVVSVIDRYLEHSRIFYFQNGGQEEIYLASADWMERNLDKRIELMFPITDRNVFKSIRKILDMYFKDNCRSHVLQKNGKWKMNFPSKKNKAYRVQEELYRHYKKHREVKKTLTNAEFIVRRKN
ncbi:polyphosphate kinase 1 [Treponema sp.]|uniref:polyphosphate kinase 1 n=1 Tax=Treponema sp. TaxID=166 RepID=UPI00298E9766|nr:polyphosphate kinase 1 [Treponema sp.]MCQ2240942.1 polyphosphate kinase 1 [Treponema sp.]